MFTGIVQTLGVVRSISRNPSGARLVVDAPQLLRPINDGASICVSGACLTVVSSDNSRIEFDVVPETLARTTLGGFSAGRRVNLERSLRAGDPMDGHVVQGHVDGTARVAQVRSGDEGHILTLSIDESILPFVIPKGSIAVDGVSLTVAAVDGETFSVALIPTTLEATTLGVLRVGDRANVETDILARTIVTTMRRWQAAAGAQPLTVDMLRENGW